VERGTKVTGGTTGNTFVVTGRIELEEEGGERKVVVDAATCEPLY